MQKTIEILTKKIDDLELKLTKITPQDVSQKIKTVTITEEPTQNHGASPELKESTQDPESGFVQNATLQNYREAILLYRAKKYSEAILAFSSFIEKNPDHILAGDAQFYIGDCYFQKNDHQLALQEYLKVIKLYNTSSSISETLRQVALLEEKLNHTENATRYKHLLFTLFPTSPAAAIPPETIKHEPIKESKVEEPQTPIPLDNPPPTVPVLEKEEKSL
ncbi:MAG: tetratricopeptide repeat protein [Deltaproteobacteria bacterium]|nr:tetratricopeptide repeat protein [Deltaproteobacteria bacterium]